MLTWTVTDSVGVIFSVRDITGMFPCERAVGEPAATAGPRRPKVIQTLGWWSRTVPYMERCRARFGKRFTLRLVGQPPLVMLSDPDEVKAVFTAPPEVLHPGEGASRVLDSCWARTR